MYVYVTKIRRTSWMQLLFLRAAAAILRLHGAPGLRSVATRTESDSFWCMEIWESKQAMLAFRRSPNHRKLFRRWKRLIGDVKQLGLESPPSAPTWEEAAALMDEGRASTQSLRLGESGAFSRVRSKSPVIILGLMAAMMAVKAITPSPIDAVGWKPEPPEADHPALRPNALLANAELLTEGPRAPEDNAFYDGYLYAGTKDGVIVHLDPERPGSLESFAAPGDETGDV
ncbi:antibiotic biosynthesis monooxygenase [Paenibacillus sp.]|uniref:antibiotic biosynthesis monooxygenase n=1 Tax=Paenibacillus sp. TaxID=58172 RepID=UPI002D58AB9A|nr:antibiotic biosynthesis monooxygenase [Paenibacillus sp.]HZG86532.1 antibiotic biosynthesis monooxygenase [Paenibacillus sp.]